MIIFLKFVTLQAEDLSVDHKPNKESEMSRILAGGGRVEFNRVNGILALSRAFGDFVYKKDANVPPEEQIVTGIILTAIIQRYFLF